MEKAKWICPKCDNTGYEVGELRAAGSFLGKLFNLQSRKFTTVTCSHCQYTELYKTDSALIGNILDLIAG